MFKAYQVNVWITNSYPKQIKFWGISIVFPFKENNKKENEEDENEEQVESKAVSLLNLMDYNF